MSLLKLWRGSDGGGGGGGGDGGGAGTLPVLILSIAAVSTDSLSSVYGFGYISGENLI